MCVIVDTNMIKGFIEPKPTEDMKPLRQYIVNGKIKLISPPKGSILSGEYKKINKTNEFLTEYSSQGFIKIISPEKLEQAEQELAFREKKYNIKYKSDDFHILVLAEASNTKLLVTNDEDLEKDFKNKKIIGGNIYKYKTQTSLLENNKCP